MALLSLGSETAYPRSLNFYNQPEAKSWHFFMNLAPHQREDLWLSSSGQLRDWHWGWRLGWLKACDLQAAPFCQDIHTQGLKDAALVVRAASIAAISEGSEYADTEVITMLKTAGRDKRNQRHGKGMYIQKNIIFALSRFEQDQADKYAEEIANYSGLLEYWQGLKRRRLDSNQGPPD